MSRIVHVHHPVPVRYVPKGGRAERFAFRKALTPVAIREEDPAAFAHVATVRSYPGAPFVVDYHAFEGRLWHRVTGRGTTQFTGFDVFDAPTFLRFLAEPGAFDPRDYEKTDLLNILRRTPLCARYQTTPGVKGPLVYDEKDSYGERSLAYEISRGEEIDLDGARRIAFDGLGRARDDLLRFMEGVVVAGDQVFVRAYGPLALVHGTEARLEHHPRCDEALTRFHLLRNLDQLFADDEEPPVPTPELSAFLESAGAGALERHDDEDLHAFLNGLPRWTMCTVSRLINSGSYIADEAAHGRILRHVESFRAWQVLAMTGSIGLGEGERLAQDYVGLVRACLENHQYPGWFNPLKWTLDLIEETYLPRLRGEGALEADDAAAMDGLAP